MYWFEILLKMLVGGFPMGGPGTGTHHAVYAADEGGAELDPDG